MRLLFILLLLVPSLANAKIKIVASITPIASLVAMVAKDEAEVHLIAQTEGCPHHYALKPSDLKKAQDADLIVYINDSFDHFAEKLAKKSNATVIKIADIRGIKLLEDNWHLWLLPKNAEIIMKHIESSLEKIIPEKAEFFKNNLKHAISKLAALEQERMQILDSGTKFILLTDSAEYLFEGGAAQKLYHSPDYSTLQGLDTLKNSDRNACYIISMEQDLAKYKHILGSSANIIQLSTENWAGSTSLEKIYLSEYDRILNVLRGK